MIRSFLINDSTNGLDNWGIKELRIEYWGIEELVVENCGIKMLRIEDWGIKELKADVAIHDYANEQLKSHIIVECYTVGSSSPLK